VRVLVIVERGINIDTSFIEEQVNTVVSVNSTPQEEGVALFTCGQANPPYDWAESFILIGECTDSFEKDPTATINANEDVLGTLVSMLQTLQDAEVETAGTE
jgi:hypothetical protein